MADATCSTRARPNRTSEHFIPQTLGALRRKSKRAAEAHLHPILSVRFDLQARLSECFASKDDFRIDLQWDCKFDEVTPSACARVLRALRNGGRACGRA
eukprot:2891548-Pleurochrysis_carterae.AAC.2